MAGKLDQHDEYLGDGVYASFDGWHIWLRADGPNGAHRIALDSSVFAALLTYRDRVDKESKGGR